MNYGHQIHKMHLRVLVTDYEAVKTALETMDFYVDDLVFEADKDEDMYVHLDFEEMSFYIESEDKNTVVLYVRLNSPGATWDDLNLSEGLQPKDITPELIKNSSLNNYTIGATIGDKSYDCFKILEAAILADSETIELKIPEEAYNSFNECI